MLAHVDAYVEGATEHLIAVEPDGRFSIPPELFGAWERMPTRVLGDFEIRLTNWAAGGSVAPVGTKGHLAAVLWEQYPSPRVHLRPIKIGTWNGNERPPLTWIAANSLATRLQVGFWDYLHATIPGPFVMRSIPGSEDYGAILEVRPAMDQGALINLQGLPDDSDHLLPQDLRILEPLVAALVRFEQELRDTNEHVESLSMAIGELASTLKAGRGRGRLRWVLLWLVGILGQIALNIGSAAAWDHRVNVIRAFERLFGGAFS